MTHPYALWLSGVSADTWPNIRPEACNALRTGPFPLALGHFWSTSGLKVSKLLHDSSSGVPRSSTKQLRPYFSARGCLEKAVRPDWLCGCCLFSACLLPPPTPQTLLTERALACHSLLLSRCTCCNRLGLVSETSHRNALWDSRNQALERPIARSHCSQTMFTRPPGCRAGRALFFVQFRAKLVR